MMWRAPHSPGVLRNRECRPGHVRAGSRSAAFGASGRDRARDEEPGRVPTTAGVRLPVDPGSVPPPTGGTRRPLDRDSPPTPFRAVQGGRAPRSLDAPPRSLRCRRRRRRRDRLALDGCGRGRSAGRKRTWISRPVDRRGVRPADREPAPLSRRRFHHCDPRPGVQVAVPTGGLSVRVVAAGASGRVVRCSVRIGIRSFERCHRM